MNDGESIDFERFMRKEKKPKLRYGKVFYTQRKLISLSSHKPCLLNNPRLSDE